MKIKCLKCGQYEFDITVTELDLAHTPVISVNCPTCSTPIAVQNRPGGGIEIARDQHLERQRTGS